METKHYILEDKLSKQGCSKFFKTALCELGREIEMLLDTFHKHVDIKKYVFALNEATWIGLLNNAMIRSFGDNVTTLQEMGIYKANRYFGRVDLMANWKGNENGEAVYFIFEAKQYEEQNYQTILNDSSSYLSSIYQQGLGYYRANKLYFNNAQVFIVPIVWGWMRKDGLVEEALKYKGFNNENDESIDFCSLYYEGPNGVWVYGKVCEVQA